MRGRTAHALGIALVLLLLPVAAVADAGVPMVMVTLPGMLLALVPVIVLESVIYRKTLGLPLRQAMWPTTLANLLSTLVGIPLAWGMQFGMEMLSPGGDRAHGLETWGDRLFAVTVQGAWLIPYEGDVRWMIPAATLVGLIPAYFASVALEYLAIKWRFQYKNAATVRRAVWRANSVSYAVLAAMVVVWMALALLIRA